MGAVTYASFITLRGLWATPMLMGRHGYTLVQSGHVLLAASVAALLGPPAFGLLKVGGRARRLWIIGCVVFCAAGFAALALSSQALLDVGLTISFGFLTGYFVLQYADVRASYSENVVGRALAVFNTAAFLGVAVLQWMTGFAASMAAERNADLLTAVFAVIAAFLAAALLMFLVLPWPHQAQR